MAVRPTDTKEAILRLGTEFIQTYGYNAFSYADISKELHIKNAAVHYHFPGKENLLAGIIDQHIQRYRELAITFANPGIPSKQKLQSIISRYSALCDQGRICLIGSVCADYHTLPDSVKTRLSELIGLVLGMVEKVLREGKKKGELQFTETARVKSMLLMTNLAAGVQLARITGQKDYTAICNSLLKQIVV